MACPSSVGFEVDALVTPLKPSSAATAIDLFIIGSTRL